MILWGWCLCQRTKVYLGVAMSQSIYVRSCPLITGWFKLYLQEGRAKKKKKERRNRTAKNSFVRQTAAKSSLYVAPDAFYLLMKLVHFPWMNWIRRSSRSNGTVDCVLDFTFPSSLENKLTAIAWTCWLVTTYKIFFTRKTATVNPAPGVLNQFNILIDSCMTTYDLGEHVVFLVVSFGLSKTHSI